MARYVIMGVAGCGKSSVGQAVAKNIGARFIDGDDLHPPANIQKMSEGTPLTDEDRAPWLAAVGDTLGRETPPTIIACSALKRDYRDIIRDHAKADVTFLHLTGARAVIEARMSAREGHFMPVSLLDSQFATLEQLAADELHFLADIDQNFEEVVGTFTSQIRGSTS
ncbi:gluconokinase [Algirhabdus cladophorae]|uniref:gluconokinase n=1 Tax=Algirhabdus cladophorae TaxID=3377108 RepID=UPI003B84A31D